jgi:RimJ/RimL family protein N-acetyltransferase
VTDTIQSPRLILSRSTIGRLSALITGPHEYERVFGHPVADGYVEAGVLPYSLRKAQESAENRRWWLPYLVMHQADAALIGVCGCKGPPDAQGFLEIGYEIAPIYQGRGLGTEAVSALVNHALTRSGVTGISAHTLPQAGASARLLAKCGFIRTADFDDPDDGMLWRWELNPRVSRET